MGLAERANSAWDVYVVLPRKIALLFLTPRLILLKALGYILDLILQINIANNVLFAVSVWAGDIFANGQFQF